MELLHCGSRSCFWILGDWWLPFPHKALSSPSVSFGLNRAKHFYWVDVAAFLVLSHMPLVSFTTTVSRESQWKSHACGALNGPGIRGLHIGITLSENKVYHRKKNSKACILGNLFSKLKMVTLFCTVRDEMPMASCNYGFIHQILLNPWVKHLERPWISGWTSADFVPVAGTK